MDGIILDGKKYISAKQAAEITKYSSDYIGQLVRAGILPGRLIGRTRFIEEEALIKYSNEASVKSYNHAIPRHRHQETIFQPQTPELEETETPEEIKATLNDSYLENLPTGYSHGWQSRSRFDPVTEIDIKIENPRKNILNETVSLIRGKLPHTTAFVSILFVISGMYILFYSGATDGIVSYIKDKEIAVQESIKPSLTGMLSYKANGLTASLASAGILGDIGGIIKNTVDKASMSFYGAVNGLFFNNQKLAKESPEPTDLTSAKKQNFINALSLRTYQNISRSGNRLASFMGSLFSGAKQNIFAIFSEKSAETTVPPSKPETPSKQAIKLKEPTVEKTKSVALKPPTSQSATENPKIIERIIERVVEKVPATMVTTAAPEASSAEVDSKLEQLKNKVFSEIYKVADGLSSKTSTVYQAVSLTNKIDNLNRVAISNSTITGSTYAGSVTGTSGTFSDSLSVTGGFTGSSGTFSGNLTVEGAPTFYGALTIPYFTATSTTATSTIAGPFLNTFVSSIVHSFGSWSPGVSGANPLAASVIINPATATADSNLLALAVGGSAKFLIDAEGDVFANSITAAGGVTLSTTTASTFSVENHTTLGDSITDTTTINGTLIVTGTTTASTVAGNFGIGTTSPYAKLSVVGPAIAEYFHATSTTATSTFAGGFSAAGSTGLTVLQNGNVGIGTTSPGAALDIGTGNLKFSTTGQRIVGDFSNGTHSNRLLFQTGTTNDSTTLGAIPNGTAVVAQMNFYNSSDSNNSAIARIGMSSTAATLNSTGVGTFTSLPLQLAAGGVTAMTVDTSGNVGIGTTSPESKFHIKTGTDQNIKFSSFVNGGNGTALTASNDIAGNKNNFEIIAGNIILTPSDNVGIGTSTPYSKLSVWGSGTGANQLVNFANSASTTLFTVLENGNVGIGTTSPSSKFAFETSASNYGIFGRDIGYNLIYGAPATGGDALLTLFNQNGSANNNYSLKIQDNTGVRFVVNTAGNVGIGTTGPSGKLHVSDSAYPQIYIDDNTSRTFALGVSASTLRIRDVTGAADRVTIDASGNIITGGGGIKWKVLSGTTDGSGNLSVAHGLTLSNIISIDATVFVNGNAKSDPGEYGGHVYADSTNVVIDGSLAGNWAGRSAKIVVFYAD